VVDVPAYVRGISMSIDFDVIVIGAGAAGMMCAIEAGKRKKRVLILEKTNRPGKKILMSGGGRCNFTNMYATPENYISNNPHFCKSALSRYTPWHFIEMVKKHGIAFHEKKLGQLFCDGKSQEIVDMLLEECAHEKVKIYLEQQITDIQKTNEGFVVISNGKKLKTHSLVIATGGLSIPTLGSSPFGYKIAEDFGLKVYPTKAGLVPITLHPHDKEKFAELSGIAIEARVGCESQYFDENILFTHRGLSGPAILQISSFWHSETDIHIQLLPNQNWLAILDAAKKQSPEVLLKNILSDYFPKKMISQFFPEKLIQMPMKQLEIKEMHEVTQMIEQWRLKPAGTEGYRTAEVTLGGVDCNELSSQSMEAKKIPELYFIGEVIDVTGWLGGFNFQWAWASGWAAGQFVGGME
jgi:predicted Rossmann fold flavoprotein